MKQIGMIICLIVLSCSKDIDTTTDSKIALGEITSIETLQRIPLGLTDTVVVTFTGGTNGCYKPHHLNAGITGLSTVLYAYYYLPGQPVICTDNIPIHTLKYIFKPTSKGIYVYKSFNTKITATTIVY